MNGGVCAALRRRAEKSRLKAGKGACSRDGTRRSEAIKEELRFLPAWEESGGKGADAVAPTERRVAEGGGNVPPLFRAYPPR